MPEDLYTKILNIPEGERPPHYYDLLGLELFKVEKEVIDKAGIDRVKKLQEWQLHPDQISVQIIFEQVSVACIVLKSPSKKREYDIQLSKRLGIEFVPEEVLADEDDSGLAEELKRLIQNNVCPVCSLENEAGSKYCANCGGSIRRNCPECSKDVSIHSQFCTGCGTDIDGFKQAENTLKQIKELKDSKNWTRIIEEYSFLPENPRLPGDKGKEILTELNNLNNEAENKLGEVRTQKARKKRMVLIFGIVTIGMIAGIMIIISIIISSARRSEYQGLIDEANTYQTQYKWEQAVSAYQKALKVSGYENDKTTKSCLADIETKINNYKNVLSDAERYLKSKKWVEAEKSFQKVLKMPGYEEDQTAQEGLKKIAKEIEKEYALVLAEAKELLSRQKWEQASGLYKKILALPGYGNNKDCIDGLKKAEMMIKEYTVAIEKAEKQLSGKDYESAKASYQKVLKIPGYVNDRTALEGLRRIKEAEERLKNVAKHEKKVKRDKLIETLAPYLIKGQWKIALLKFKKLPDNDSFPEIKTILTQLDDLDKNVINSFKKDIGKEISLNIKGKIRTVTVRSVTGREICCVRKKTEKYIDIDDLRGSDKINRLSEMNSVTKAIYLAADAIKRQKHETAKKYLKNTGDFSELFYKQLEIVKNKFQITKGLVAYYSFDEGKGRELRNSSSNKSGLIHGAKWVKGKSGKALKFDGNNDYVTLPPILLGDFTIGAWFKVDSPPLTWARIFECGVEGKQGIADICITANHGRTGGDIGFTIHASDIRNDLGSKVKTSLGEWYHVVATYDQNGPGMMLYINGKYTGFNKYNNESFKNWDLPQKWYLGKSHWNHDPYFSGIIDEVIIFNRPLSGEEIKKLYELISPQSLLEY